MATLEIPAVRLIIGTVLITCLCTGCITNPEGPWILLKQWIKVGMLRELFTKYGWHNMLTRVSMEIEFTHRDRIQPTGRPFWISIGRRLIRGNNFRVSYLVVRS